MDILKYLNSTYSSIGIEPINGNIPANFSLEQNYPNPFNPITKISFSVPVVSMTKLTVFDVTGKEISVLVNKELKAGTYNINFDAGSLPSGAYFYKLESGSFKETKKMVLIK